MSKMSEVFTLISEGLEHGDAYSEIAYELQNEYPALSFENAYSLIESVLKFNRVVSEIVA